MGNGNNNPLNAQKQVKTKNKMETRSAAEFTEPDGISMDPPAYNVAVGDPPPPPLSLSTSAQVSGNNNDTQRGMYSSGNSMVTGSNIQANDVKFDPATMKSSLQDAHFQGEGTQELSDAMIVLYSRPSGPELDQALQVVASIRGMDFKVAKQQYEYAMQIKDAGEEHAKKKKGDDYEEISSGFSQEDLAEGGKHHGFTGSAGQLRFGMILGDVFGIDPVFGSLISPTGGAVGPGDKSFSNMDADNPTVLHGTVHDAAGYLLNGHGMGPGYNYLNSGIEPLGTDNPLTGQLSGMSYWNDTNYSKFENTGSGYEFSTGLMDWQFGNSTLEVGNMKGFIGSMPSESGGTKYGLSGSRNKFKANIDLAEIGQGLWGTGTISESRIANLEVGLGTSAIDAWVDTNAGFSFGAQANLGEMALTLGTQDADSHQDRTARFGVSKGAGAALRGHWGDSDNDGFREFGFGADIGSMSFDYKTEDPLRDMVSAVSPLSSHLLPNDLNLSHAAYDQVTGLASDAWSATKGAWNAGSDLLSNGWNSVKSETSEIWGAITTKAQEVMSDAREFSSDVWNTISSGATGLYADAQQKASELVQGATRVAGNIKNRATGAFDSIKNSLFNFGAGAWSRVKGLAQDVWGQTNQLAAQAITKAQQLASQIKQSAQQKIAQAKANAKAMMQKGIQKAKRIKDGLLAAGQKSISIIKQKISSMGSNVAGLASDAGGFVKKMISDAKQSVVQKISAVKGAASQAFQSMKSFAGNTITKVSSTIKKYGSKVKGLAQNAWESTKSKANAAWESTKSTATNIGQSILSSVSGLASDAGSKISDAASSFGNTIKGGWNKFKSLF